MAVQVNPVADIVGGAVTAVSLHSSDGGSTGADELVGGSYSRQTPDYSGAATGGTDDLANPVTFGGPAAPSTANHLGFWAGTTWLGSSALTTPKSGFEDPDTLTVTSAPIVVS